MLQVEHLSAGYGRRQVLHDVSLDIPRGAVTALVGDNGSGKTTLLRALLGLLPVRAGAVRAVDGHPPRIGYVPQADASEVLFPVTAGEVVAMGLTPRLGPLQRAGPAEHDAVADALLRLEVEALAERPFRELSGGQRQRVLLARGIVAEPDLLALDEPVRGLDFASSERLVTLLVDLARERELAIVIATHSLDLVANHADAVALFQGGSVTWGPAHEIFTDELLTRYHGLPVRVRSVEGRRVVLPGAAPS